jgi:hypothetical protein
MASAHSASEKWERCGGLGPVVAEAGACEVGEGEVDAGGGVGEEGADEGAGGADGGHARGGGVGFGSVLGVGVGRRGRAETVD